MSEPTRVYKGNNIAVEWRPELCVHCKHCIEGLPAVFDLARRPWVDVNAASANEIREQVSKCPIGALKVRE